MGQLGPPNPSFFGLDKKIYFTNNFDLGRGHIHKSQLKRRNLIEQHLWK